MQTVEPTRTQVLDFCALEPVGAPRRVGIRLGAPEPVVDVQRRDGVAELAQHVEQARRIRTTGDEADDRLPRLEQRVPANVLLDAGRELAHAGRRRER